MSKQTKTGALIEELRETKDARRTLEILVDLFEDKKYHKNLKKFPLSHCDSVTSAIGEIISDYQLNPDALKMIQSKPIVFVKGNDSWVISYEEQYADSAWDGPYIMGPYIHIDRGILFKRYGGK